MVWSSSELIALLLAQAPAQQGAAEAMLHAEHIPGVEALPEQPTEQDLQLQFAEPEPLEELSTGPPPDPTLGAQVSSPNGMRFTYAALS